MLLYVHILRKKAYRQLKLGRFFLLWRLNKTTILIRMAYKEIKILEVKRNFKRRKTLEGN